MTLVTQNKASTYKYAPTRQALSKKSREVPRPKYFYEKDGHLKIDIEHPAWIRMIEKRSRQSKILKFPQKIKKMLSEENEQPKKKVKLNIKSKKKEKETVIKKEEETGKSEPEDDHEFKELIKESYRADLEEQILKNEKLRYDNEIRKVELQKKASILIEISLAKFLFLGYMEKCNIEFLTLCKKIKPAIDNMVKEQDTAGVLKRFNREFTNILKGIQKAQDEDLKGGRGRGESNKSFSQANSNNAI